MRAVNGEPDCAVKVPLSVQSFRSLPAFPSCGRKEPLPAGDEKTQFKFSVCRWSKLERPRSARRSLSSCATVAPPPPKVEALSIDLPNAYSAFTAKPLCMRRVARTVPEWKMELPSELSNVKPCALLICRL